MSLLPQSAGYATIVGGGIFFALLINGVTFIQARYTRYDPSKVEEFSSASRSIKSGMLSVGVTSAWVWGSVFLVTATLCYAEGLATAWWFACGGLAEISAFAFLASKVKVNAGGASTFLQVAKVRFGTLGHVTFAVAALASNFVVGSQILVGGSGIVSGLTGINVYAAVWLFPFVITIYVLTGGLRATFIADYLHCCILFTCLLVLVISTYAHGTVLGSPGKLYDLLQEVAITAPAAGNAHGSYTTFKSDGAMYYAVISSTCFYGLSLLDQSYFQRAVAARPEATSKSFIFAGFFFFSIAFATGTSMGLSARALENTPAWPTYPNPLTGTQIGAGLAGPFAATAILGHAGAAMYLIIVFMATTSAFSAQLVAVSTLMAFDLFKPYFRSHATNSEMMRINHLVVVLWAIFMAIICTVFVRIGIALNFLFYFMGVVTSPAVVPIILLMTWSKLNKVGAVGGVIGGMIMGFVAWLVTTKTLLGEINTTTTQSNLPIIAGGLVGLGTGAIISTVSSLIAPANFDFNIARAIGGRFDRQSETGGDSNEEKVANDKVDSALQRIDGDGRDAETDAAYDEGVVKLEASQTKFRIITVAILIIVYVLIPAPLAATAHIYSKGLFTLQCVVSTIFLFTSTLLIIFWPIIESIPELKLLWGRISRNERSDKGRTFQE